MSNILVTGGAGLIGANLCKKLLTQRHEVIAVDNFITSTRKNLTQLESHPNFTFIRHDINRPFPVAMGTQMSTIDYIYHLACPTGVSNLRRLAKEILLTCSEGTKNVLELSVKTGAKVLFTSSSEVYGDPQVFPQDETYYGNVDPVGFRSPYEEGKRFAESLVATYVQKYHIKAITVRIFNTYGPGMSEKDTRVIPQFLRQARREDPLTVEGKGTQTRTFCHVDDLINGLLLVMSKGKVGEIYNVGSNVEITIINLAKLIKKLTKSHSAIQFIARPSHDHNRRHPDLSKIRTLGWKQKISLEEGLKNTLKEHI